MKRDLRFEAIYPHPPERVWRALTDRQALAAWLMENDFEPRLGHQFTFRMRPVPGFDGIVRCQVTELEPPRRLAYTWKADKLDTTVRYLLEPVADGTRLVLEHCGFCGVGGMMDSLILANGWKKLVGKKLPAVVERLTEAGLAPATAAPAEEGYDPVPLLLARYAAGVEVLREALRELPAGELDRAPGAGKWSAHQTALHIVDAEIVGTARLRWIAAQPGSLLPGYAGDVWGEKLNYAAQALEPALELFALLRRCTAAMLGGLPAAAWEHKAVFQESASEVTLASYLLAHCEHAEAHMEEIAALAPAGAR
ncbi:MAG TPA: SRPBCC domain-containing protein [Terriglobales bacterium]|nr:SRPBCC domain-containing protein [Terriglobales bacterium]